MNKYKTQAKDKSKRKSKVNLTKGAHGGGRKATAEPMPLHHTEELQPIDNVAWYKRLWRAITRR